MDNENNKNPNDIGEKSDRDDKGRFVEGNDSKGGRPIGTKNYLTQLEEALKEYETEKGKTLFRRLIERAFINDMVLLSVAKKFVADKTQTEITTPEPVEIVIHRAKDES